MSNRLFTEPPFCLLIRCLLILVASMSRNVNEPSSRFIYLFFFSKYDVFKMINSIKIYIHEAFLYSSKKCIPSAH